MRRTMAVLVGVMAFSMVVLSAEWWMAQQGDMLRVSALDLSAKYRQDDTPVVVPPPLGDFSDVSRRTLFLPNRGLLRVAPAQQPTAQAVSPPAPPALQAILIAVILSPNAAVALIETSPGQPAIRLTIGQSLNGWKLIAISRTYVDVQNGTAQKRLLLRDVKPSQGKVEFTLDVLLQTAELLCQHRIS